MKILYMTQTFPPEPGSTQRPHKQAVHLQRLGHDVTVLTSMPYYPTGRVSPPYAGRLWMEETIEGIRTVRVWSLPASNRGVVRRALSQLSFAIAATVVGICLRRHELVIAYIPHLGTEFAGLVAGRIHGSRVLLELGDLIPQNLEPLGVRQDSLIARSLAAYFRQIYRWVDWIAVPYPSFTAVLRELGVRAGRILLLPHAADPEQIDVGGGADVRRRFQLSEKFVAVYSGSFNPQYNLTTLVLAAEHLAHSHPRIHFLLLGGGGERDSLERMITEKRLTNIRIADPVPPDQVGPYLQAADLFISPDSVPKSYEGCLYTKLCEYLMVGRPVLVVEPTPIVGPFLKEIGAGLFVRNDPEELAQAILFFATHTEELQRCGANARKFARENLIRSEVVTRFESDLRRKMAGSEAADTKMLKLTNGAGGV